MITIEDPEILRKICGPHDRNLKELEHLLDARIFTKGNEIHLDVNTEQFPLFAEIIEDLEYSARKNQNLDFYTVRTIYQACSSENGDNREKLKNIQVSIPGGPHTIVPRNLNQSHYIETMANHDLAFGLGPAGTGKTYLAIAYALGEVLSRRCRKLILSRPVIEAGENLGYLPGDLTQKLDPYLKPLYDAMEDLLQPGTLQKMQENHLIEISPLAYMRGRSLRTSIVVLDEAQNTTQEQMKMFLTRLGEGSRAIITGDVTQIDLPIKEKSGLLQAIKILKGVGGIGFSSFTREDVVRHPLVKKILEAYEQEHSR
jgi:phosphate starvation-inducible protein PhoH and related proteins